MITLLHPQSRQHYPLTTYSVFSYLWVLATLIHVGERMHWLTTPAYTLLTIASLAYLLVPRVQLFLLICALQIAACWTALPWVDNHWFFMLCVNLIILAGWLPAAITHKRQWPQHTEPTFATIAPVLRVIVVIFYACVALHKSNADFFDAKVSCVLHFYGRIAHADYMLPLPEQLTGGWAVFGMYAVYGLVAGTALFLAFRHTWLAGLTLGMLFHIPTGVLMMHFPSIIMPMYFLFIPSQVQTKLFKQIEDWLQRWSRTHLHLLRLWLLYGLLVTGICYVRFSLDDWLGVSQRDLQQFWHLWLRVWLVLVLALFGWFLVTVWRQRLYRLYDKRPFITTQPWLYLFAVLFTLNCLTPYLGLKTHTAMSMWSNLRTEAGVSNHLLLPANALKLFGYQEDTVRIVESNDAWLQRQVRSDLLLTWTQFYRRVRELMANNRRNITITYERNGLLMGTKQAERDPLFQKPEPLLSQKLLVFRAFPRHGQFPCAW